MKVFISGFNLKADLGFISLSDRILYLTNIKKTMYFKLNYSSKGFTFFILPSIFHLIYQAMCFNLVKTFCYYSRVEPWFHWLFLDRSRYLSPLCKPAHSWFRFLYLCRAFITLIWTLKIFNRNSLNICQPSFRAVKTFHRASTAICNFRQMRKKLEWQRNIQICENKWRKQKIHKCFTKIYIFANAIISL